MRSVSIPARQIGQNRPRNGKAGSPKRKKHYPIGLLALQRVMSMPHDQQRHQPQTVAARRSCDWRRRRQAPPTAMKSRRDGRRLVMEDDEDERRDDGGFFLTGFSSAKSLVELTCYILKNALSLDCFTLDTMYGSRCSDEISGWRSPMGSSILREAHRALVAIRRYIDDKMALNERLNKYKLQQGRCQTTLSGIAASQTSIPRSNISPRVQPINDDTEKLRRIGLVRMSSVGAQLNLVFELLYMTRQALTAEQINVATYVHVHGNKVVFDCLRNNQKVHFDGIRFSYKSKYDLKGRDQLLSLIGEFPGVLPVVDVKDAYLAVLGDLKSLLALTPICPSCSWT
uniref:TFIIE beta domain-containing protein n=2 Tax=Leersia perrieri TaxID=77586 RepID=A0A0D9VQ56_9ORYZ